MTGWFYWPLIVASMVTFVWVTAAVGYHRDVSRPFKVSAQTFGGPVREYVFPSGFIAALACLLTTLLVDRVAAYPPMANALQAAAIMFTVAAIVGLVMYQSIENMKTDDGVHVELKSAAMLAMLGAVYAILSSALVTILIAILLSLGMPPKSAASAKVDALVSKETTDG